jgi:hypothetical protein
MMIGPGGLLLVVPSPMHVLSQSQSQFYGCHCKTINSSHEYSELVHI